ncbi:MAG TPA: TetR/AcrR family transcriptional regulator [Solirubrobacteraceae bacterium]|nr:TetR/AcrR family transcriptional regulator [Solirubrobacteraceae bacterium]
MTTPPAPAREVAHTSNTGEAILEAALELMEQRGYHATSMRDIAAAVDVRAAGIYHWYESKEAILVKLQDDFMHELTGEVEAAIERQSSPEARMAAAVSAHVRFHGLHTRAAFVTDSEIRALSAGNRKLLLDKRDAYQQRFVGLIEDGVSSGVFTVTEVRVAAFAILLQCTGVALWFNPRGRLTLDEVTDIHIELALGSLGARRRSIAAAIRATRR